MSQNIIDIDIERIQEERKLEKDGISQLELRLAKYKKEELLWLQERICWQEERAERVSERRLWQGLQLSWEEGSAIERRKLSVLAEEIRSKWEEVWFVLFYFCMYYLYSILFYCILL